MMSEKKLPANSVELEQPIERGKNKIDMVQLRRPAAGELRGLSLMDVMQLDVNAMKKLLPRISKPALTEHEFEGMDPADFMQLSGMAAGFLVPKEQGSLKA